MQQRIDEQVQPQEQGKVVEEHWIFAKLTWNGLRRNLETNEESGDQGLQAVNHSAVENRDVHL